MKIVLQKSGSDSPINFFNFSNLTILKTISIPNFFISTLLTFLPFFAITIFELSKSNNFLNFKNTSIWRINNSKGYAGADIWYFFLGLLSGEFPLIIILSTAGFSILNSNVSNWFHNLYSSVIKIPTSTFISSLIFIIVIITADLINYLRHYFSHKLPLLWDIHEFHHSATEMTILSNFRKDHLAGILLFPFTLPFEALTGLLMNEYISQRYIIPLYIFLIDSLVTVSATFFGHSSLKIIYPKPLSNILMSPALHWLHHSSNEEHYDCNFGEKFVFWDKFFNTYLDESHINEIKGFGVPGTQYNKHHPLFSYIILPVLKVSKRVRKFL